MDYSYQKYGNKLKKNIYRILYKWILIGVLTNLYKLYKNKTLITLLNKLKAKYVRITYNCWRIL